SNADQKTCVWPGYGAVYFGTNEQGVDLYYCDIPKLHTNIIWNNAGNNAQTVDIELDGVNDFFTASTSKNSEGKYPVTSSVWDYELPTESEETTEPIESSNNTTTAETSADTTVSESSEETTTSEIIETTTETEITESSTKVEETSTSFVSRYKLGDVDLSGTIDISDVTIIQKYIVLLQPLTDEQLMLADVDGNGYVSIKDASLIQRYIAKIITDFTSEPASLSSNVSERTKKEVVNLAATSLSAKLSEVKSILEAYYTFSSYDQYQSLKKLYYQYRNNSSVENESEVVTKFDTLISDLNTIAEHIGVKKVYPIGDIYFFENTYDWSNVYAYAWKGSSNNGTWPGVRMQKIGTNYGHDVYGIKFEYAGQYSQIIFNDGKTSGAAQTVNIELNKYEFNCFHLKDKTDSEGKIQVGNFNFESSVLPTLPNSTTNNVDDDKRYAMCYYNQGSHAWTDIDTFLKPQGNSKYSLDFIAANSNDINMCIYDNSLAKYNCVSSSTNFTYTAGNEYNYSLVGAGSRGSSITIKGLSSGLTLSIVYDSSDNSVKITCKGSIGYDPTEAPTTNPIDDTVNYTFYMAPAASDISAGNTFRINIKDSTNSYHAYYFNKTDMKFNGVDVYSVEVSNPGYSNVIKVQYQVYDSNDKYVNQVADEKTTTLSYYSGK
ncbi:MAG: starch-binding protein, partial [Ruminococcus sp.]|nr:starch-binding protein [Ruminococcus sp.]